MVVAAPPAAVPAAVEIRSGRNGCDDGRRAAAAEESKLRTNNSKSCCLRASPIRVCWKWSSVVNVNKSCVFVERFV